MYCVRGRFEVTFRCFENVWHKGVNESNEPAHIIEVWKGAELTEDDIERQD